MSRGDEIFLVSGKGIVFSLQSRLCRFDTCCGLFRPREKAMKEYNLHSEFNIDLHIATNLTAALTRHASETPQNRDHSISFSLFRNAIHNLEPFISIIYCCKLIVALTCSNTLKFYKNVIFRHAKV